MHKSKRKVLKIVTILLVIVLILSVALIFISTFDKKQGIFPTFNEDEKLFEYEGREYALKNDIETFLVIGLDKYEDAVVNNSYNNDQRADFLMLFVFDNLNQKCTAIHINRDTMAQMNVLGVAGQTIDTVTKQIALSHTYGNGRDVSCRNTADAVSQLLLGVKVNHYISFTMDSVPTLNDLVGGVEVTVLDDFTGIDDTLIEGETVTLMGEHALNYVRTRYGLDDSSNSDRMERQRQYLKALYSKAKQCIDNNENFIVDATLKMADYIVSDRTVNQLQEITRKFSDYDFSEICYIDGDLVCGDEFMEFYPNEDSVKSTVISLFYEPVN